MMWKVFGVFVLAAVVASVSAVAAAVYVIQEGGKAS